MAARADTKWVYDFSEGSREMRDLLGGKGANVAEMARVLGPEHVPAGVTITTEACVAYMGARHTEPEALEEKVDEGLARLEALPASASATPETLCSCPCARAPASRCRG